LDSKFIGIVAVASVLTFSGLLRADFQSSYAHANEAFKQRDWDAALRDYRLAEKADPKAGSAVWGEANCLYVQGQKRAALKAYRRALALMPGTAYLADRVRKVEAELGRDSGAKGSGKASGKASDAGDGEAAGPDRFAIGVGYPDVRARLKLWRSLDIEAKVALGQGEQAYSGRLLARPWSFGPLDLSTGVEAGYFIYDNQSTLSGNGTFGELFVGLEYPFARYLRLSVDIGPTWVQANSQGQSLAELQWTYNTALYFYLF
jgi:tetratricopeptide (TPR) repeat protein